MVFSSAVFLFYFLPVVVIFYFIANRNLLLQNFILLLASLTFYFWGEKQYTVLVLASVVLNYIMGIAIAGSREGWKRWWLGLAVTANLGMLLYFKYFGFLISNLEWLTGNPEWTASVSAIPLPLGISFFTFHGITYIVDIYRRDARVSWNPLNVGLYTLFFPQLVAGPIVRYKELDHQLTGRKVTRERLYTGVKRFIIGLAKKILIANTMGAIADDIYNLNPTYMSSSVLWLAAGCYMLQIYFDFSGYSDMAIGLAKIFGFDFPENFNFPYSAASIKDFWRRWHISLSTFFRDYVYIPLGGSKHGILRTYLNLILVFFLTGFWHGASWNFILWGLYHGSFLILERVGLDKILAKLPAVFRHVYTLLVVLVGWVLFRVEDFALLNTVMRKMLLLDGISQTNVYPVWLFLDTFSIVILLAGVFFSFPILRNLRNRIPATVSDNIALRFTVEVIYLSLFVLSIAMMATSTFNPFIYFRF